MRRDGEPAAFLADCLLALVLSGLVGLAWYHVSGAWRLFIIPLTVFVAWYWAAIPRFHGPRLKRWSGQVAWPLHRHEPAWILRADIDPHWPPNHTHYMLGCARCRRQLHRGEYEERPEYPHRDDLQERL